MITNLEDVSAGLLAEMLEDALAIVAAVQAALPREVRPPIEQRDGEADDLAQN
jgi:hypothetical protein